MPRLVGLTPPPLLACASQDTRAAQEKELESLREQLEGVNRNIEEVEANMKTLGVNLVQVGGGGGGGAAPLGLGHGGA